MDPELQALGLQLADAAARNTAAGIADRIRGRKAKKQDQETISELEDIVNNLVADKAELVRIAQSFEEELVAQKISDHDVSYIVNNVLPVFEQLMKAGSESSEPSAIQAQLDVLRPILSAETLTILQLLGFNFRKGIGEPLTVLVSQLILSNAAGNPDVAQELRRAELEYQTVMMNLAKDPKALQRLQQLSK